ncbi:hypothetical protein SAZ_15580 [Streptomyces noursei ZPM]|nr:hypothetical protein SAZ_15580 [Streptomyces noursei ZPM]EPY93242.1 hypothetical protein K530_49050 [Streptomyces noursei CCRC 11814]
MLDLVSEAGAALATVIGEFPPLCVRAQRAHGATDRSLRPGRRGGRGHP